MAEQQKKITGYRDLTQEEIELMNEIKGLAKLCSEQIEKLMSLEGIDLRAVALAKTNLQQGFMWAVRSVAKPLDF